MHHPVSIRHAHVSLPPRAEPPARKAWGRVLAVGLELVVAAAISFGFFTLFLINLAIVFPEGLSIETLIAPVSQAPETVRRVEQTQPVTAPAPATEPLGRLVIVRSAVRSKPAGAITWSPAADGQELWDRDGVQTGTEGRARIDFGTGGELILEPNSLIILSAGSRGATGQRRSRAVLVQEGEIWARFSVAASAPPKIVVGGAVLEPGQASEAGTPLEFRVHARPEGGSTISVLKGSLELAAGADRVRLEAGDFGQISVGGTVASARRLPPTPRPERPSSAATFHYRRQLPQIEFRWAEVPRATRYRLVVTREVPERAVTVDERVAWPSLTVGRLEAGRYQWRVSALYGEVEGLPSAWRTLTLVYEGQAAKSGSDAVPEPGARPTDSLRTEAGGDRTDGGRGPR